MEITKVSESYNPVFKRKELSFFIDNVSKSTPKLYEARVSLAKEHSANEDAAYILRLDTETGTNRSYGKAEIYDSAETAKKVVPKHIQMRNAPSRREKKEQKETPQKTTEPKRTEETKKKKEEPVKKTEEPMKKKVEESKKKAEEPKKG